MKFALNDNNDRIEVTKSGERATCSSCFAEVVGNFGKIRPKYWRHLSKHCDDWYEPMSEWHLEWQNYFPEKNQEITIKGPDGTAHRADIQLNNGTVIEIQYSPIKIDEIEKRENFYGKNNLIWVINGATLARNSSITYPRERNIYYFKINIPKSIDKFKNYSIDEIQSHFRDTAIFFELYNQSDRRFATVHNGFEFESSINFDFEKLKILVENTITEISEKLYGDNFYEVFTATFSVDSGRRPKADDEDVSLVKKFWRPFLTKITFPLFFENLPGLDNGDLYWYQKNRIIKKQSFLKKYLAHT